MPDTIDQWADRIGMARRTLTRRFTAETGLSFAQWRQQARLLKAVELLSLASP
jgi:AraC-like DNA-binding protein